VNTKESDVQYGTNEPTEAPITALNYELRQAAHVLVAPSRSTGKGSVG